MGVGSLLLGAVAYYLMGGNPFVYLASNVGSVGGGAAAEQPQNQAQDDDRKSFSSVVLADTEDVWKAVFAQRSLRYRAPKMVLFRGETNSACGRANRAAGPFYCPGDERVYLDLSFFDELSGKLGAKGEFADAYVIAHEVGHHVQQLLGLNDGRAGQQNGISAVDRNQASVKIELQADCLAGVWARKTDTQKKMIEPGDIESAMGAAAAVGDDRLQRLAQGTVVPDSFTHGSSSQRTRAFQAGYRGGELESCIR